PLTSEAVAGAPTRRPTIETKTVTPAPASTEDSPLAAIAQAIAAEVTAPTRAVPSGSLEASEPVNGVVATGNVSANSASWAKALTDEVENPAGAAIERRQPPAPEVVVMPPVAEPGAP